MSKNVYCSRTDLHEDVITQGSHEMALRLYIYFCTMVWRLSVWKGCWVDWSDSSNVSCWDNPLWLKVAVRFDIHSSLCCHLISTYVQECSALDNVRIVQPDSSPYVNYVDNGLLKKKLTPDLPQNIQIHPLLPLTASYKLPKCSCKNSKKLKLGSWFRQWNTNM